jgi:AcrR family transcriptional regulator
VNTSPARRGRPPRHSAADVVRAGVALADAEGLAAVTMRAVAARLGAPVMSLYSYVPDKPALVQAMVEQVSVSLDLPALTGDWRRDLAGTGRAQRSLLHRHPWLIDAISHRRPPGPGTLAYLEHVLGALEPTGLSPAERLVVGSLLTGFVVNVVRSELLEVDGPEPSPLEAAALGALLGSGRYPRFASLVASAGAAPVPPLADLFEDLLARTIEGLVAASPRDTGR